MRQLVLNLNLVPPATLENFIPGRNQEVLHALHALTTNDGAPGHGERFIHLWGEKGSGRTHLLRALVNQPITQQARAAYIDCASDTLPTQFDEQSIQCLWCIDNVHQANAQQQIALFNLINMLRASSSGAIVTSSDAAPQHLQLSAEREDLRTRLSWGLVLRLQILSDQEKEIALMQHAKQRGLILTSAITRYLLRHFMRDMPSLINLINALDLYTLEHQRHLSLPMIRAYLRSNPHRISQPTLS